MTSPSLNPSPSPKPLPPDPRVQGMEFAIAFAPFQQEPGKTMTVADLISDATAITGFLKSP